MKKFLSNAVRPASQAVGGLTVGAVIWAYATFAGKSDVAELRMQSQRQWQVISELRQDVAAYDAIIRYYFTGNTNKP